MFDSALKLGLHSSYPPPLPPAVNSHLQAYLDKKMDLEGLYKKGARVNHPKQFALQIRKSSVDHPESGYGVFVEGRAPVGTVLGVYPGRVYFPSQLSEEIVKNNEYLISRFDGFVIDAREWTRRVHEMRRREESLLLLDPAQGDRAQGDLVQGDSAQAVQGDSAHNPVDPARRAVHGKTAALKNPFALGHYVNHPPPSAFPNVMSYSFNFLNTWPHPELIPHENAPRTWMQFEGMPDILYRTIVLVSNREIVDEELFLNYRYNPAHPYPDWYSQPDPDAANRRWAKQSLFSL